LNDDIDWNHLDSQLYCKKNYATLHQNDLKFVAKVRDFLAEQLQGRSGLSGVDVGAGANLYPSLAMLPFCADLTLLDCSSSNITWLNREIDDYSAIWTPFWTVLAEDPAYAAISHPREAVRDRARTEEASVFGLPRDRWDLGTMFFVAESISSELTEFRAAVKRFISALKPGSPFAVAFMENSEGWSVGSRAFPAVAVCDVDIEGSLSSDTEIHELFRLGVGMDPIRAGYTGMILVCGKKLVTES
jgi:hypothetical protein